ncbi:MAG: NAD(P)H-hydrate dehydratase [Galbitalea sp.]
MQTTYTAWSARDAAACIAVPGEDDDKYLRGVLGVITGSTQYPGAAVLGVEAALRTGVGMVRYLGPASPTGLVLARRPEAVTTNGRVQAWLIGSGMASASPGSAPNESAQWIAAALAQEVPVVLDGGALDRHSSAAGPVVITPHYRELAAVLGVDVDDIAADPGAAAARAADSLGVTVLLKGHTTFVASPDGTRLSASLAPAWLATAGGGRRPRRGARGAGRDARERRRRRFRAAGTAGRDGIRDPRSRRGTRLPRRAGDDPRSRRRGVPDGCRAAGGLVELGPREPGDTLERMTAASPARSRWRGSLPRAVSRTLSRTASAVAKSPTAIWSSFVLTHLWLGYLNFTAPGLPLGDVIIQYKFWAEQADLATFYVGIDKAWVYPIVALVPIVAAAIFGFNNYAGAWLSLVFVLDVIAFAVLVGWRRPGRSPAIGWWWIAFLLLLGPIALGRIDSISVPIALVAVLLLASRPRVAALLLTLATWIKVWPAALIAAVLIASRDRLKILVTVAVTSAVIVGIALALGAGGNVFSFVSQQASRGLQVESPASTIWMWMAYAHVPGAFPYYDQAINTFEVTGPQALAVAGMLTPLLGLVSLAIAVLGIVAVQRGTPVTELLAPLALAFVTAFIAFNKVGSPQYMTWLAVPVILGLVTNAMGHGRSFRIPAVFTLFTATLTQCFYPYLYNNLLELQFPLLLALSARNIFILVLFAWAVSLLIEFTRPFARHEKLADVDAGSWLPLAWPFTDRAGQRRGSADDDSEQTTTAKT